MENFLRSFLSVFKTFGIIDVLDILAVAFIIYYAIRLVRETRAMQLVKSIGVIFVIYFVADYLNMVTLRFLLKNVLDVGLIVLVVLFQPELRRALERIGRSRLTDFPRLGLASIESDEKTEQLIDIICKSCEGIISRGDGALIVLERDTKLGDVIRTGTKVDADPSPELIGNIFFTNSPLHDGAMVIRDGRILAAGCYLPLSDNLTINKEMGTRHRAALGVSEVSDAITIVVSEERGIISVTQDSLMKTGLNPKNLKKVLESKLITPPSEIRKKWSLSKRKKKDEE